MINLKPFSNRIIKICHHIVGGIKSDGKTKEQIIADTIAREPLPNVDVLEMVLTSCYEASLQTDEGRPCHFSVVYTKDGCPSFSRSAKISLEPPIIFDANNLSAMSTVHASKAGALLWTLSPDGEPVIIEIVAHSPSGNDGSRYSPGGLRISCEGPGKIDVKYLMHSIATIDGIKEVFVVLGQTIDPSDYVLKATWNLNKIIGIDLLNSMIEKIRSHGHGGSIWIADIEETDSMKIKFPVNQQNSHRSREDETTPWQYLDQYARLANTDGAVLFNWQGILKGFGVFGSVDKEKEIRVAGPTGDLGFRSIEKLGGARKQSAATFVSRHEGAAALVVSQDGQATIIHRDGENVVSATVGVSVLSP